MISRTLIQTYERYGRWAPPAAAALLAWLVGSALAQLAWQFVPTPQASRWQAPPAAPASESRGGHGPDIAAIAMASLFGRYAPPQNLAAQALLAAPDTQLSLTLIGILADKNAKGSRALIADSGGDQKPYAVGDLVARNATVQAIFPDRVILSREGRLETLRLDKESPGGGFTPSGVQPGFGAPGNSAADSVAQLAQVREQILSDPTKAGNYIRIQPNQPNGALHGYRVYPGSNRAAFTAAGLRPGDLVTSVNGVELDDPTKALQMLGDLSQATQLSLTVERGGQTQYINLSLE